ncbi:MAG: alpha/beta hydrolase [Elainella sp. Prado103]|jgi:pimeloyl-ACP methyl ester carboxylesterase|nr:alpha/beta hydrolase [Elainella sp. Prado103]
MLQPPGFYQCTLTTGLGTIVYYTAADPTISADPEVEATDWIDRRTPLVFLHGFGGGSSAYEWSLVYPAFAAQYRVLAPDLLGWGRSHHLTRSYQIQDYLTTITEFLEQLCPAGAVVLASSLTAGFVVRLAITRPELFKQLILVAPSGLADFDQPYKNFFAQLVSLPLVDRLVYGTLIATTTGIRSFLENRQFARASRVSQEMVDAYLASALQPNAEYSALSFVRGDLCFDLAPFMPQITVPTLVIWGRLAQFTPLELGQRLTDLNSRSIQPLVVIRGVGLTPQLELPAVMIGLITQQLATLK